MLNPEEIPKDTSEDVARRELVMQNSPSETMEDCQSHANDLKFTNRRGQNIGEVTQLLDPGVDEVKKVLLYTQLVKSQEWKSQQVM